MDILSHECVSGEISAGEKTVWRAVSDMSETRKKSEEVFVYTHFICCFHTFYVLSCRKELAALAENTTIRIYNEHRWLLHVPVTINKIS
jgi:hypothetical protein